jgi:co-chaperonin GroES (HSP10)
MTMKKLHDAAVAGRVRPTRNLVLIQVLPAEREKRTAGGILIPDNANGRANVGTVLAVGLDVQDIEKGELVMYDPSRMRLVLADGQLANAQGTPYAGPGECGILHQDDCRLAVTNGTRIGR